jgi:hypothetical protein
MPIEQISNTITFYAMYIASKVGKTGLTVTIDVWECTQAGVYTEIVTGGSATELGDGVYYYALASGSVDAVGEYIAVFKTADTSVDAQHIPAIWTVGRAGVEDLDATVSSRAVAGDAMTLANNAITAAVIATGAIDADAIAADAVTEIQAGLATPATVWSYTTRTLTQAAATVAAATSGSLLTITRGDSLSASITGLGDISTYVSLDITIKQRESDTDNQAILRVRKNASGLSDGLIRVNGAAPSSAALASITIDSLALGNITVAVDETITDDLAPKQGLYYDIQMITATAVTTLTAGTCNVTADVTRAVA